MKGTQTTYLHQPNRQTTELRKVKISQAKETTMREDTSHPKGYHSNDRAGTKVKQR
jgi:hypothetical protein